MEIKRGCIKRNLKFQNAYNLVTASNKTPKSPEGDFKAAPLGEVWRGKSKTCLQIVSLKNQNRSFDKSSS
jgi:hypothetical protein